MRTERSTRPSTGWIALIVTAAFAGLWARLSGFGQRGLAVDEVFFLRSAQSILAHGLPSLPGGGFYVVGLIPQYLTALSVALLGSTEAAVRLPALLAGFALPPLAYRYARGHASPAVAMAVAGALLVSSWEIEFSRFGRMYAVFGCATLAFLTRFDRSLAGAEWGRRYWTHGWAVIAVLCHIEGALLAPLLFAPLLDPTRFKARRELLRYAVLTGVVVAALAAFAAFDFRRWGVAEAYPLGYEPAWAGSLRRPAAPLWAFGMGPTASFAVVLGTLLAGFVWSVIQTWRGRLSESGATTALACIAGLLHQLAPAALLTAILVLRSRGEARLRALFGKLVLVAACAAVWPVFLMFRLEALDAGAAGSRLAAVRELFFGWPDWYESLWRPWSASLPWLGAVVAAAVAAGLFLNRKRPWIELLATPAGVAAYGMLSMGLVQYFYEGVRYHYFLYPVLLTAVAATAARLVGPMRGTMVFLVLFALCGDFDPVHIARAGGEEAAFRMGRFQDRADVWYRRNDYRSAAAALEDLAAGGAPVVIGTGEPLAYYFGGEPVRYLDRAEFPFWEQSRERGTVELWTGRPLLSTAEDLRRWSAGKTEILLARRVPGDVRELAPPSVWPDRLVAEKEEFRSVDGGIDIVRVTLSLQPSSE